MNQVVHNDIQTPAVLPKAFAEGKTEATCMNDYRA